MAGMLPGVECARRRRFHQTTSSFDSPARRPSFCLYTTNYDLNSTASQRKPTRQVVYFEDEKLDQVARGAKERLNERLKLRSLSKSQTKRGLNKEVHHQAGRKRLFSWGKLSLWRSSSSSSSSSSEEDNNNNNNMNNEEECAVYLEQFKHGEALTHLPCAHRFHSNCLVPWLHTNAHCPCCRFQIPTLS